MNLDIRICLEFSALSLGFNLEIAELGLLRLRLATAAAPRNDKKSEVSLIMWMSTDISANLSSG